MLDGSAAFVPRTWHISRIIDQSVETFFSLQVRLVFCTGFLPPLRFCTWVFSRIKLCSSASGEDSENEASSECSVLGTVSKSSAFDMSTGLRVAGVPPTTWFSRPTTVPFRKGARGCASSHALDRSKWSWADYVLFSCVRSRRGRKLKESR